MLVQLACRWNGKFCVLLLFPRVENLTFSLALYIFLCYIYIYIYIYIVWL